MNKYDKNNEIHFIIATEKGNIETIKYYINKI